MTLSAPDHPPKKIPAPMPQARRSRRSTSREIVYRYGSRQPTPSVPSPGTERTSRVPPVTLSVLPAPWPTAPSPVACIPRSPPDPPGRLDAAAGSWRCVPHRPCPSCRRHRRLSPQTNCARSLTFQLPDARLRLASLHRSQRLPRKPSSPQATTQTQPQ